MSRGAVQQAFDRFCREASLVKRSGSCYRHGDEVIAVCNLQRSQYGPMYYFNQGFWILSLGDERYPKPNKCHIQARLEDLIPTAEQRIGELLNLDYGMSQEERVAELVALLERELRPLIEQGSSVRALSALHQAGRFAGAAVTGPFNW